MLAHLHTPPNYPTEDRPEIAQKRLDRQNNAFYPLQQALDMLPPAPPALRLCDEKTMPYGYKPIYGSLGELLDIQRPDDDPLMLEYIDACAPALHTALQALEKPYFLIDRSTFDSFLAFHFHTRRLLRLPALLLATAARQECSDDPERDCCLLLLQAIDLARIINSDGHSWGMPGKPTASRVLQKARPQHRQMLMQGFQRMREQWIDPLPAIEAEFQDLYGLTAKDVIDNKRSVDTVSRITIPFSLAAQKKWHHKNHDSICKIACMTFHEYEQNKAQLNLDWRSSPAGSYVGANSDWFTALAGFETVVALEQFKTDHGHYPDKAAELVPEYLPELPKEAYTGNELIYSRKGQWYLLYCVNRCAEIAAKRRIYNVIHIPPGVSETALHLDQGASPAAHRDMH